MVSAVVIPESVRSLVQAVGIHDDLPEATDDLRGFVDGLNPSTAPDAADLLDVILLWIATAPPQDPRLPAWTGYARDTGRRLHGDDHPRTRRAALAHTAVRAGDPIDPYAFLDSITTEAMALAGRDEYDQAARLLRRSLRDLDATTAPPNGWIMTAALLYAEYAGNTDDDTGLGWAWYAYRTARPGTRQPRSVGPRLRVGGPRRPPARDHPAGTGRHPRHQQAGRHLTHATTRMSLAETMHASGSCGAAIRHATTALNAYTAVQDEPSSKPGFWYLIKVLRLLDLCCRTEEALALLEQWRPRLPTTDIERDRAAIVGMLYLGNITEAQSHQPRCAARLGDRIGLATDKPAICAVHTPARGTEIRRAFLRALGTPDDEDDDTPDRPGVRCTCTPPPTSRHRSALELILDTLITNLLRLRFHLAARQATRRFGAATAGHPPAQKAGRSRL